MSRFAENTSVSTEASRGEIERTLQRYGATGFMYGWQGAAAMVAFEMEERRVKFVLPLPDKSSFKYTPGRKLERSQAEQLKAWEQACRQRWRALALVIKAKLEAVESGITCFEDEFLAHIVLPDGSTVSNFMRPQLALAYERGTMPPLLPDLRGGKP